MTSNLPKFYDGRMTRSETLERGGGVAIWRQIAERLRTEISLDIWKTDERLPSEADLAVRFGVNRHTVRRAVAALAEDGILKANQGRGTFVAQKPIRYPIAARTRFSEIVSSQDREPGGELIAHAIEPADDALATRLDVAPGSGLLRLETVRFADGIPIGAGINWYPADRFPTLVDAFARSGSITAALRENGLDDYRRTQTLVSADVADPQDCALLDIAAGDPILVIESVNEDLEGRIFNVSRSRMAAARVQLSIDS